MMYLTPTTPHQRMENSSILSSLSTPKFTRSTITRAAHFQLNFIEYKVLLALESKELLTNKLLNLKNKIHGFTSSRRTCGHLTRKVQSRVKTIPMGTTFGTWVLSTWEHRCNYFGSIGTLVQVLSCPGLMTATLVNRHALQIWE